jgi:membrane protein
LKIQIPKLITKTYHIVSDFVVQIERHHIFLLSAAVAFNVVLYIIPLILVGIYLTYLFFGTNNFNEVATNLLFTFLPETEQSYFFVSELLKETDKIFSLSSVVGWIGILTLLWLSSTVFSSLRSGLNVVFDAKTTKVFVLYKLKDILLTFILSFFVLLLGYILPFINLITKSLFDSLPDWLGSLLSKATLQITWITLYFVFFFFVYKFIPNRKLPFAIVLLSSIFCTILAEISRQIFTYYLLNIANYSRFYGAYGFIVAIVVWVYYLFFIILFSGELSTFIFHRRQNKNISKVDKEKVELGEY